MICFKSSTDTCFPYGDVKELYEFNRKFNVSGNDCGIDQLIKNCQGHFWAVFVDNTFSGVIYFHNFNGDTCYLSGFSKRKQQKYSTVAVYIICLVYFRDYKIRKVYFQTKNKHTRMFLIRSGFLHESKKDDIYTYSFERGI